MHVHERGLGSADDSAVWQIREGTWFHPCFQGLRFSRSKHTARTSAEIHLVRAENCSTREIENLLRAATGVIKGFIEQDQESYLALGLVESPAVARNKKGALARALKFSSLCEAVLCVTLCPLW